MDVPVSNTSVYAPVQQGVALQQLVSLFRRHIWLIGVCAALGMVGAYLYARGVPKSFTATSLIAVEGDRFAIPELQGALRAENSPDPMPWVRTEMQAITSRDLLQPVIKKRQLELAPEFNSALQPPGLLQVIQDNIRLLLPSQPTTAGGAGPDEAILGAVSRAVAVFQDNRSLVIEVSFTSRDPQRSADVVNTLVSEYIASRANRRSSATQGANTVLTERVEQARLDLTGIEKQMQALRASSELVGLRAGSVGQQQLEELATAAARAGLERAQLQTTFDRATALAKQGASDALGSVLGSATIQRLRDQEATSSRRVAELSSRYGSGYPGIRSAQAEASSAQRQLREETQRIVTSLGTQLRVARAQETDVQKQLEEARRAGIIAENARAQLEQLQRESVSRRGLYQTLLERAQQTVTQPSGTETPDVRIVSQAAPPLAPSSPNMKLAAGAGGMAGVLVGCLLTLTRRNKSVGFSGTSDLLATTGLTATASVSRAQLGRGRSALPTRVLSSAGAAQADEMRALRGRVMRLGRASVPRSIAFTGTTPGDEAATIATAYARIAALDGDRVLLVEGNLQDPHLASWMKDTSGGLLRLLQDGGDWRDMVVRDADTPLDLLTATKPTERSHALLGGVPFQNLLIEAQARYDMVVLTAPAAATVDALTLAQRADVTALVVDGSGVGRHVQGAVDRLGAASRNPLAIVLISA